MANADAALREPGRDGALREERACVVCARRFWSEELRPVILFQDPAAGAPETVDGEEEDQRVKKIAPSQQRRLCRVLGVQRYLERWPQLQARPEAIAELKASAVEHPFLKEELLLLHRRRMPADVRDPCDVCRECCGPLTSSMVSLPRYSLANDLWIGRQLPALRNLAAATKRLLPMVRTCLQVTVLQPGNLVREERQKGFIGNSIFLPQAAPTAIRAVLPPPEQDMQESILFVLVGDGQNKTALQSSALLKAPRGEYESAVRCLQSTSPYYEEVTRPSDLPTYFERCGVAHIWWFIEDPTVKDPNTELAKHRQSAGECLAFWKDLMHVLWDVASYYWNHDIRFTPLFHCFGGINRSTAALCAWLVIWWDLSVEDAIDCVLQQRPSLRPWKRRAYVLYALRSLEHHKHAWRWEFETS